MKLELSEWLKIGLLAIGLAVTWGAFGTRVSALEKATEPVPQMRIDIEVVKAGMITMSSAMAVLAEEQRRRARRDP